jgi:2-(1,2-epoxy-1,2-dihydrophenyl)acetyl-CoA isomerase
MPDVNVDRLDGLCRIELNRPDALNAWTPEFGRGLLAAVNEASNDPAVRAILITGAGRAFSAGADLKEPRETLPSGEPDLSGRLRTIYGPIMMAIAGAPKPVVAAVNGPAAGIGAALALVCDLIVAAESSYILLGFVNIGLIPDGGSSYMLASRVGYGRAIQLAMLGARLPARDALDWGVINAVFPDDAFREQALEYAGRLAAGPTVALGNMKRVLRSAAHAALEAQLYLEAEFQQENATTEDYLEGVAAFREKRRAQFKGR